MTSISSNTDRTDLIETIARAMWDAREKTLPERTRMTWKAGTDGARSCCWLMAEEALTAINEAGLVIVPRKPTHEMCQLGDPSRFAPDDTEAIWTAMIDANPLKSGSAKE